MILSDHWYLIYEQTLLLSVTKIYNFYTKTYFNQFLYENVFLIIILIKFTIFYL
mgnify:CR=1 FL=1